MRSSLDPSCGEPPRDLDKSLCLGQMAGDVCQVAIRAMSLDSLDDAKHCQLQQCLALPHALAQALPLEARQQWRGPFLRRPTIALG
jgi:hypothetical protein